MPHAFCHEVGHAGFLQLRGHEAFDLLQRLSTNDLTQLQVGGVAQTILTTEKGRILDVVNVLRRSHDDCVITGHTWSGDELRTWIEKFIIMENIIVEPMAGIHMLVWSEDEGIASLQPVGLTPHEFQSLRDDNGNIVAYLFPSELTKGNLVHLLILDVNSREGVTGNLGLSAVGRQAFDRFRIANRLPWTPNEISESINPLEVNLTKLVSFTKGCYVGQEVIARLDTYRKVQKHLRRVECEEPPEAVPAPLFHNHEEVGAITTAVPGVRQALGFIRSTLAKKTRMYFISAKGHVDVRVSESN